MVLQMFTYAAIILISIALRKANAPEQEPYIAYYIREKCHLIDFNCARLLHWMDMYQCMEMHNELKNGEDYYKFYCANILEQPCAEIVVPYYVECLNSEEQYLSKFLISSFQEIVNHMCSKEKVDFLNVIKSLKEVKCIANGTFSDLTTKCFDTVFKKDGQREFVLSQSFVCGELSEFKICLEEAVQINCESILFSDFLSEFFYPFVNWCKSN